MQTPAAREDAIKDACRGIDLDADDELMLAGFAHSWDARLTERVCSLLERVREAGYLTALTDRTPPTALATPQHSGERGRWVPGNTGPGY